jgi:hypothetical protein
MSDSPLPRPVSSRPVFRILDPTLPAPGRAAQIGAAARPVALRGARVGLLANGKTHGMAFLDRVAARLAERHAIGELVRVTKGNASAPARAEDADHLAKQCAAVVTAIGD